MKEDGGVISAQYQIDIIITCRALQFSSAVQELARINKFKANWKGIKNAEHKTNGEKSNYIRCK